MFFEIPLFEPTFTIFTKDGKDSEGGFIFDGRGPYAVEPLRLDSLKPALQSMAAEGLITADLVSQFLDSYFGASTPINNSTMSAFEKLSRADKFRVDISELTKDEDYQEALDMLRAGMPVFFSTGFEYHSAAMVLTPDHRVYWGDRDMYQIVPGIYKSQLVYPEWNTTLIRNLTKRMKNSKMPAGMASKNSYLIRPLTAVIRGGCGTETLKMGVWILAKYYKLGNLKTRELMRRIHVEEWNIVAREYERLSQIIKRSVNEEELLRACRSGMVLAYLRLYNKQKAIFPLPASLKIEPKDILDCNRAFFLSFKKSHQSRLRGWAGQQEKKSFHRNTPSKRKLLEMLMEKQNKWSLPQTVADFILDDIVARKEFHPYLRVLAYIFRFRGIGIASFVKQEGITPKDMTPFDSDYAGFTLMDALLLCHRTKKDIYISSEDFECIFEMYLRGSPDHKKLLTIRRFETEPSYQLRIVRPTTKACYYEVLFLENVSFYNYDAVVAALSRTLSQLFRKDFELYPEFGKLEDLTIDLAMARKSKNYIKEFPFPRLAERCQLSYFKPEILSEYDKKAKKELELATIEVKKPLYEQPPPQPMVIVTGSSPKQTSSASSLLVLSTPAQKASSEDDDLSLKESKTEDEKEKDKISHLFFFIPGGLLVIVLSASFYFFLRKQRNPQIAFAT